MSRGIVFDLDDTLYLERDYVRSGFSFIADLMAKGPAWRRKSLLLPVGFVSTGKEETSLTSV